MKVKELIEKLKRVDPGQECDVYILVNSWTGEDSSYRMIRDVYMEDGLEVAIETFGKNK